MCYRLILIAIVIIPNVAHSVERIGLTHHPLPSPDGEHLVLISERTYHPDKQDFSLMHSECSLTLWTANRHDDFFIQYSLTPRIHDVIRSPNGNVIAYLSLDMNLWYAICFYFPDRGEAFGIEYCDTGTTIDKIQLSTDLEWIRYYIRARIDRDKPVYDAKPNLPPSKSITRLFPNLTPRKSIKQKLSDVINGQWTASGVHTGEYLFTKKEQDKIEWAAIERPEEIPAFLTQPVPKIQKDTQMQWSPDSKSLYLLNEKGIWRSDIGKPFVYQWTLILEIPSILRFQLSPKGTHLLYEVSLETPYELTLEQQEEREIWILNLESGSPNKLGKGWASAFSHDGNTLFYGNFDEFQEYNLDGTLDQPLNMAARGPATWYNPNPFTMHGTCICADDGTPLDNEVVTYEGNDYKNVTVVKWEGGRQEGKTTTTSSGAYTFKNTPPRGYHLKLTVTSTHYHQHGTGASSALKKCTYSHTEYLRDVGNVVETVERNFALKPDTVDPAPGDPN